ncbi:hypothetical protein Q4511_02695 [Paracoccus sp. 1_MG-2023]|uniref:hypothetical protein n=1 Tax=unclassified Paracoccus (in: a-proteobacteria) TaxID=2688777 RepID=UPI001C08194C|nr:MULTISPECIES: hypothetical protein [unclassified Paracoccus (in: a-proteobacteria)]MBU2956143.1 hypothetical protein [Paracoccus sp. C2R09]MDO6667819.1 hypothetical protein [Paracoccus sp. 1_MG-2023]
MGRMREVGTLWIGGALSWMEQLCLMSFVDAGQKITLFHYEDIPNVPDGVICRDGREVIDTDDFIKYERKNSYALFADLFRLHMIRCNPGMIWVDTDVYCQKVMDYDDDHVFGFELPGSDRVNNAVLGMPADSPALAAMIEFTSDRHSIAPFLSMADRKAYAAARDAGRPVHVCQQPWGIWGPTMLTHYIREFGLTDRVQPVAAFYPVTFRECMLFNGHAERVEERIAPRTTAMHVWASNKRELGKHHLGLPPPGSWWQKALAKHGIEPALAPITGRNIASFDTALLERIPAIEGAVCDISGGARSLVISLHMRDGCEVRLIDMDRDGRFGQRPDAMEDYRATLVRNGVDPDAIRIITREQDLAPADVLLNLRGFGDQAKIKRLTPILERCLHSESRLYSDIRKGSGAFPFFHAHGNTEILSERENGTVRRVVMQPDPPAPQSDGSWAEIATQLAGTDGFFREGPKGHSFLHVPRNSDVLVVTFDNLDIAMNKRPDRRPWGHDFIEKQGWSMLGVLAGGWTWYREPWVAEEFDRLRDSGFFARFRRVVFYGASMGGYAAAAFSAACPGAHVVAISPQSTLDRSLVPWETRYRTAWDLDYSGPYGDAAKVSETAAKVTILYDPYEPLDSGHVGRFTSDNVVKLRCPLMGHRLGSSLSQMGILTPTILRALSGDLDEVEFYRTLRARRDFPRYHKELFKRAVARERPDLARRVGRWVLARGPNRAVRLGMKALGDGRDT